MVWVRGTLGYGCVCARATDGVAQRGRLCPSYERARIHPQTLTSLSLPRPTRTHASEISEMPQRKKKRDQVQQSEIEMACVKQFCGICKPDVAPNLPGVACRPDPVIHGLYHYTGTEPPIRTINGKLRLNLSQEHKDANAAEEEATRASDDTFVISWRGVLVFFSICISVIIHFYKRSSS
jgi:hypothetical protein